MCPKVYVHDAAQEISKVNERCVISIGLLVSEMKEHSLFHLGNDENEIAFNIFWVSNVIRKWEESETK